MLILVMWPALMTSHNQDKTAEGLPYYTPFLVDADVISNHTQDLKSKDEPFKFQT